jgi:hypothetical protein
VVDVKNLSHRQVKEFQPAGIRVSVRSPVPFPSDARIPFEAGFRVTGPPRAPVAPSAENRASVVG